MYWSFFNMFLFSLSDFKQLHRERALPKRIISNPKEGILYLLSGNLY